MKGIEKLIKTVKKLRSPNGCPWDKQQTHKTLKRYLIEETYEAIDAIEKNDLSLLKEELGDVLLQIILHAQIASEKKKFTFNDICEEINKKMVTRHPHVFSNTKVKNVKEVMVNWEKIKASENNKRNNNLFENIPKSLPALIYASKTSKKAAKKGIEWKKEDDIWRTLSSEILEFKVAHKKKRKKEQIDEMGDILFTVVNIARWNQIDPEDALKLSTKKFMNRFNKVNTELKKANITLIPGNKNINQTLDKFWKKAKINEREKKK